MSGSGVRTEAEAGSVLMNDPSSIVSVMAVGGATCVTAMTGLALCTSSYMVRLAGESGISDELGLDGTLTGAATIAPAAAAAVRAPLSGTTVLAACLLLLRMLSLNLRSMVSRNLSRLWLTELNPPSV